MSVEMGVDKWACNPAGTKVFFSEKDHRYWSVFQGPIDPGGPAELVVNYTSVTGVLKGCFPPFEEERLAERSAARRGVTKEEVIAEWRASGRAACRLGTRVHAVAEDAVLGRAARLVPESEHERGLMRVAWQVATRIREMWQVVAAEQIVFSTLVDVAGQIDLAARDGDGVLWLLDWKTNREIRRDSRYGVKGVGPVGHLDDCEFNRYALQLSMYEWILREEGYIGRRAGVRRAVVHLTAAGAELIELPDLGYEVGCVLLHRAMTPPF